MIEIRTKRFLLLDMVEKAGAVVPSRDAFPFLKNFFVDVRDGRVLVAATDLELSLLTVLEVAQTSGSGAFVLPAGRFSEIVHSAAGDDFVIRAGSESAVIASGACEWTVALHRAEDFPRLPDVSGLDVSSVSCKQFYDSLSGVRLAVSRDSSRPALSLLEIRQGQMTATDGLRFARTAVEDGFPSMEIPVTAVPELLRLMESVDGDVIDVGQTDNHLVFFAGPDVFIVQKMVARFPDVEQEIVLPMLSNTKQLVVDRDSLASVVRRVRIAADPSTSAVSFRAEPGGLLVSARDAGGNSSRESVDVQWDEPPHEVVLHAAHVMDALASCSEDVCSLWFGTDTKTKKSPVVVRDSRGSVSVLFQMRELL